MRKTIRITSVFLGAGLAAAAISFVTAQNDAAPENGERRGAVSADTAAGRAPDAREPRDGAAPEREPPHPMAIETLRSRAYPGGEFTVERVLPDGTGYHREIVSYESEGLKIRGLLTVPSGPAPDGGWPAVVFLHGYIPPDRYSTVESYPTYQAALARAGFVTFKPDLRGHDESEGEPVGAHFSEKYVVDTLFAIAYLKAHPEVDPARIGYWGHSNGGEIGLRVLTVSPDIKAASFWAGVVGSYRHMFETRIDDISFLRRAPSTDLVRNNGLPSENPEFWNRLDPYAFLDGITAPVQLQHATGDESVPVELSRELKAALEDAGKAVEYIEYEGDDHNIARNSGTAWERTIRFFREHL